jgi:hypothetical protein
MHKEFERIVIQAFLSIGKRMTKLNSDNLWNLESADFRIKGENQ